MQSSWLEQKNQNFLKFISMNSILHLNKAC